MIAILYLALLIFEVLVGVTWGSKYVFVLLPEPQSWWLLPVIADL